MSARGKGIAIGAQARIELPFRQFDQPTIHVVILVHPVHEGAKRFGGSAVVERIALRDEDAKRATQIPELPLRVVEVAAGRVLR